MEKFDGTKWNHFFQVNIYSKQSIFYILFMDINRWVKMLSSLFMSRLIGFEIGLSWNWNSGKIKSTFVRFGLRISVGNWFDFFLSCQSAQNLSRSTRFSNKISLLIISKLNHFEIEFDSFFVELISKWNKLTKNLINLLKSEWIRPQITFYLCVLF